MVITESKESRVNIKDLWSFLVKHQITPTALKMTQQASGVYCNDLKDYIKLNYYTNGLNLEKYIFVLL